MPKPMIVEGQTATNPSTGERIVYQGGKWYPVGSAPAPKSKGFPEVAAARNRAMQSSSLASQAQDFLKLNQETGTGQLLALPGVAEMVMPFSDKLAAMQAITNQMAPAMRPVGSGATSDKDIAIYKRSIPNVDFGGPANAQIANRLSAKAKTDTQYADFLEEYASTHGTTTGGDKAWRSMTALRAQVPQRKTAATSSWGSLTVKD